MSSLWVLKGKIFFKYSINIYIVQISLIKIRGTFKFQLICVKQIFNNEYILR